MEINDYKKYRWFFTSSDKLVIGGKSDSQNDALLEMLKKSNQDFILMHTSMPGSPFTAIISPIDQVTKQDEKECAIFTGCFSRAWKEKVEKTQISVFKLSSVYKDKKMKAGTWGVSDKSKEIQITLELVLTKQKNIYRAVPINLVNGKKIKIIPGGVPKDKFVNFLINTLNLEESKTDELMSALPAGSFKTKTS